MTVLDKFLCFQDNDCAKTLMEIVIVLVMEKLVVTMKAMRLF